MNDSADEEINFEPEDEMGDIAAAQAKIKKLRDQLKEAQSKRDEYLDGWQRSKADGVNARREAREAADRTTDRTKESVIEDFIPSLDSFDMAFGTDAWLSVESTWKAGIEQIYNQLISVLTRYGVEKYGKVGDVVDHARYEIVQEVTDSDHASGEIVRVLRFGYAHGDRILRPAQVIIAA